jgi:hypothetical protein
VAKPDILPMAQIALPYVQEYERYLPTAFDESLSILEKINLTIQYMGEIGATSQSMIDKWNEVYEYVMGSGMTDEINAKLDAMVADGTMDTIINQNIFNDLNGKIDTATTDIVQMKNALGVSIEEYGGSATATTAANKTALQSAIADVDAKGGGIVIVPPNMNYGYDRQSTSTHPDMSAVLNNTVVIDFSESFSSTTPGSRDGMQIREFFRTQGDQKDGLHDGNGRWIRGQWHPYLSISHDDPTADNRRASVMFCNDGNTTWMIGQGTTTGLTLTDDEKSNFKIGGILDGGTGLTTVMSILKTNGFWGFNVAAPVYDYHFVAKRGASVSTNGNYMFDNEKDGDTNLLIGTSLKMRKITLKNDSAGEIQITNNTGASVVASINDQGGGEFRGGVGYACTTANRPTNAKAGFMVFDLDLNKPIWFRSAGQWFDATGTQV